MQQRKIQTDGLAQSILEAGEGPLVILCHGFPELGFSWRRQLPALAAAGFHAVAPDMRGYGATERPEAVDAYTILHLVGDMVDLVRALGREQAVIVGHDWGAPVAWHAALLRPDVFRAVAALSVPFQPRRPGRPPIETYRTIAARKKLGEFYMVQFQPPGAEVAFEADVATGLTKAFYAYDGATPDDRRSTGFTPEGVAFLDSIADPVRPPWMDDQELQTYVAAFEASGFSGPFHWYRNLDRNWSLTAFAQDRTVDVPALFAVGGKDPVRGYAGHAETELERWVPDLRNQVVIPGAGHWLQQERPDEVNQLLIEFLQGLE